MTLLHLYFFFMKYGLLCFGGGYVLIPMMFNDFTGEKALITHDAFGNLVSIAQLTPGPVGINAATFVGYTQNGTAGAVIASLGLITPSLAIGITALYYLSKWKSSPFVSGIFSGVRAPALALVVYAFFIFSGMAFFKSSIPWKKIYELLAFNASATFSGLGFSFSGFIIFMFILFLMLTTKLSTTWLIITGAAAGTAAVFLG